VFRIIMEVLYYMTNKVKRLLSLVMSAVMVLSMVSVNVSAKEKEYKLDDTIVSADPNEKLPALEEGLAWSEPDVKKKAMCGFAAHKHSSGYCSYHLVEGKPSDESTIARIVYEINYPNGWTKVEKDAYDTFVESLQGVGEGERYRAFYYVYDCTEHTHTESCYTYTYTWTVVVSPDSYYYSITYRFFSGSGTNPDGTIEEAIAENKKSILKLAIPSTMTYEGVTYGLVNGDDFTADPNASGYVSIDLKSSFNDKENVINIVLEYRCYGVSYKFVSGTEGKTLPEGVTNQLGLMNFTAPHGIKINVDNTAYSNVFETDGDETIGVWTFSGWTPAEDIESISDNTNFVGTWIFTAMKNFNVKYSFVSADSSLTLPEEVTAQLPDDKTVGNSVTVTPKSNFNDVAVTKDGVTVGTWSFSGWNNASVTVSDDTDFVGTWTYTEADKYTVTYAWADENNFPADAKLPTDTNSYYAGETVTIVTDEPTTTSTTKGDMQGEWTFTEWTVSPEITDGKMPASNVTVKGGWEFTEAPKYTYTLTYDGNGGVSGTETTLTDSENVTDTYATELSMTADSCEFTREHYEFQGWAETKEDADAGNVAVKAGDTVEFSSEVTSKTLYAVWKQVKYSVTVSNASTGYEFKDGDTISYSVAVNGTKLNETYTATYYAGRGWTSFTVDGVTADQVVTVTELGPHKNNYVLSVSDANGNHVSAKKGDYAQTVTIAGNTAMTFVNAYTAYAEEYTPAPVVPVNPTIPTTGDSVSTITVAVTMILMSAVVAFVAMRKREN
jgi:hypothetical protein